MRRDLVSQLRCPKTGQPLSLHNERGVGTDIDAGELVTANRENRYPIVNGIPRFVPQENYAANFGLQWNRFRRTQLDSVSGHPISRDRFYRYTGWSPSQLAGKRVLDVGCGAGRFAEIALQAGASVVALDYSGAVDACRANLRAHEALDIVQGDIFALPFEPGQFDFVYCLGVLQHTPDVERAFRALPPMLAPGGQLTVDLYPWLLRNVAWSKYWLRPLTKRLPMETLFGAIETALPVLLPTSRWIGRVPGVGRYLRYLVPVVNYEGVYPLRPDQIREWALLDTFDMLAPAHDHPQRQATLERWLQEAGLDNRSVERMGFLIGRGTRPNSDTVSSGANARRTG